MVDTLPSVKCNKFLVKSRLKCSLKIDYFSHSDFRWTLNIEDFLHINVSYYRYYTNYDCNLQEAIHIIFKKIINEEKKW